MKHNLQFTSHSNKSGFTVCVPRFFTRNRGWHGISQDISAGVLPSRLGLTGENMQEQLEPVSRKLILKPEAPARGDTAT